MAMFLQFLKSYSQRNHSHKILVFLSTCLFIYLFVIEK